MKHRYELLQRPLFATAGHSLTVQNSFFGTVTRICGNDFARGNVYPVAMDDKEGELGEMCLVCLDYLNARKHDGDDPTLDNWPARGWPTLGAEFLSLEEMGEFITRAGGELNLPDRVEDPANFHMLPA